MKTFNALFLLSFAAFSSSCNNNNPATTETQETQESKTSKPNLPYTKSSKFNWAFNQDQKNEANVLNVFRAMEQLDHETIGKYTADSIESNIDGVKFKGTRAQIMQLNKDFFATLNTLKVVPTDWRSVVNDDKTEEWVSVWFTQHWEDNKGQKDSVNVFNDIKLKNGKINVWNEYLQHFPKP
jgi:hypothetical protein